MTWRYQVVWTEHKVLDEIERVYSLCEVYLDKAERLTKWSDPGMFPTGGDLADLRGTLIHMLTEAYRYKPVRCDELKEGMKFERMPETEPPREEPEPWLIIKRGVYYAPNRSGYIGILDLAGRYTEQEAKAEASVERGITAVRLSEAPEFTDACFDDLALKHLRKQRDRAHAKLQELALMIVGAHEDVDNGADTPRHIYHHAKALLVGRNA